MFNGSRLVRLLSLAAAAIALMILGPDRLEHQAWQRLALVGGVAVAFVLSFALGRRSGNATADPVQNAALIRYALLFRRVMVIVNLGAALVGVIAVVVLRNTVPVRYLILAPITNLVLAGLFYRAARSANRHHSKLA